MSLFSAMAVSASGMAAERTRAELLVENIANAETTRTPEGGPYRRKDAVFASQPIATSFSTLFESHLQEGVGVQEISVDNRDPETALHAGTSGCRFGRLRGVPSDESGGRHGRPGWHVAQFPG